MFTRPFTIESPYKPMGDQPAAIDAIVKGFNEGPGGGKKHQILMGVTGSGKTFTMANVAARLGRPVLVISHNKTLAAQLYEEFKEVFPHNAVTYFVSYYDYYQPEAYIPQRDIYIEKDAARNDDLDRLRLATTTSLMSRRDVMVVASVSCIFGLGSPEEYKKKVLSITKGIDTSREDILHALVDLQYDRNDIEFKRGTFRVRGDVVEIFPAYETTAYRVEMFGDSIENIWHINPISGELLTEESQIFIYPAKHYVTDENNLIRAVADIRAELDQRVKELRMQGKLLEAQRLLARTKYDVEMLQETGICSGIENYSRHLAGSPPGSKPNTLVDYFPKDYLLIIDESHVTIPQINAMYAGDRHRKEVLVDHGFRLPSALDNRPMKFEEFMAMWNQVLFVSATPGKFELGLTGGEVVEQVIRPTGLVDPQIEVRPATGQVQDLIIETQKRAQKGERTLVTTLTKRLAEDLSHYMGESGLRCKYLHSEIQTFDRVEILRELREGTFDVLIGVNLLREGLDLPEVSMVAILDADKQGFLRSETSLIQMIGRCARNVGAQVYLYADSVTPSMQRAIDETNRRRGIQEAYNKEHGITPQTIIKSIRHGIDVELKARRTAREMVAQSEELYDVNETLRQLEEEMLEAANNLEFEKAAEIRDKIQALKQKAESGGGEPPRGGGESGGDGDLTAAIVSGMSNRIAGTNRPTMTPQQKKVRRGPKKNRGGQ
ncbi:MAG TPA: excinuclease ABC subunit UvrB [Phycisphaerae bacterium]|nr:excinuclease ABC subunit UvrB [Phycisphaerae bacterium]